MNKKTWLIVVICLLGLASIPFVSAAPPLRDTELTLVRVVKPTDPSAYAGLTLVGIEPRYVFDRRLGWSTIDVFLIDILFTDGTTCQAQVNIEFETEEAALKIAEKYARYIGQLPFILRNGLEKLFIHKGLYPFGGSPGLVVIHDERGDDYISSGSLEEVLIHEATHAVLDADHRSSEGWLDAQRQDGEFISNYAEDYPDREDLAESLLAWMAVRYRPERLTVAQFRAIVDTIPARLRYLDNQNFAMAPQETLGIYKFINVNSGKALSVRGNSSTNGTYLTQWTDNEWPNQKFRVSRTSDGYHTFGLRYASDKLLTVEDASTNGAKLWIWENTGNVLQKFRIEELEDGNRLLKSYQSNRAVDAARASLVNGTPIVLWDYLGGLNQRWEMVHVEDPIDGNNFFTQSYTGLRNNYEGWVGYEFTPSVDIIVDALGRPVSGSIEQNHAVRVWRVSNQTIIARTVIKPTSPVDAHGYANEKLNAPVTLHAGVTYRIASYEKNGGDSWRDIGNLSSHSDVANIHKGIFGGDYSSYPSASFRGNESGYVAPTFYYNE